MAGRRDRDYFWTLAAFGLIAICALTLGLVAFARQSDETAKLREESVVRNGLSAKMHEVEDQVVPQAIWDDAVRHLDNRFDLSWAHDNIGQFLSNVGHFAFAFVLSADNRAAYGMRDGADVSVRENSLEVSSASTLIAAVRTEELARRGQSTLSHAVQASAFQRIDGRLFIVTATLVQPDFGRAQVRRAAAPIVLTGREVDAGFLDSFSARYLLDSMHIHEGDSRFEAGEAHAAILDDRRADIATLDWVPQTQGSQLLSQILPWMVGLLVALLMVTLALYARARRAARRLLESEQQSLHMAYHDGLTGLSNRSHFEELLGDAVASAAHGHGGFALHCVDLDRFKELNDTYGHPQGDAVLKLVAERLRRLCDGRAVCARLGGDEFAVLQPIGDPVEASEFAHNVIMALSEPFELSIGPRLLGSSVGVALSAMDCVDPVEMMRRADMALYRAKGDGRGCFRFFDLEMDRVLRTMQRLKEDLRQDLSAGKLEMVYQPQVRLSGEVVGVEALARWNHAVDGPISPSIFVPLAEESGLIHALGDFTLRRAAEDGKQWPNLKTAVNVSATQLQTPGFVEHVEAIVRSVGANPSAIELELTEGVLLANEEQTRAALEALRAAGFSIALDDFGTGYSSLSYLPRFPIDKIKIDRSFVSSLGHDGKSDALFGAIVKLAQALDMRVIAEGVETNEQWLRLSAAGCPKIQGFIASRPLDAAGTLAFVEAHHPASAEGVVALPVANDAGLAAQLSDSAKLTKRA